MLEKLLGFVESIAKIIGRILNFIVLAIIFWIPVGITSISGKLFGAKFLDKNPQGKSYWIDGEISKKNIESYYRMV